MSIDIERELAADSSGGDGQQKPFQKDQRVKLSSKGIQSLGRTYTENTRGTVVSCYVDRRDSSRWFVQVKKDGYKTAQRYAAVFWEADNSPVAPPTPTQVERL